MDKSTTPATIWLSGGGGQVAAAEGWAARVAASMRAVGGIAVIETAAARAPARIVIDDGTVALSYADLMDRVYGLGQRLAAETKPGTVVASLVPNGALGPVIILACAMTGRILVPIDATHARERQSAIFGESGATMLITDAASVTLDDSFVSAAVPRLAVDAARATGARRPTAIAYDPGAPLFVAFTSGSTGRPKGVVSGGAYGTLALCHFIETFDLGPDDVILGVASLSTGGSRDAFAGLASGAKIRIADLRADGLSELLRILDEDKITVLSFIPSVLSMIMRMEGTAEAFRHLRVLDLHGEQILSEDIRLIRARLPATCLISITMGSIEAGATFGWIVDDEKLGDKFAPVGYILPERRVALLGEHGGSVAEGEIGELVVRGKMALGAWRQGKMMPGPYLPDPDAPGENIFPTGDLVRRRPDGLFEYIGRRDRRIKVNGQWADLGEIEAALRNCEGVLDAAVIAQSKADARDRVVAFVAVSGAPPALAALRAGVAAQTAAHMVPAQFNFVGAIPRLSNFKPDLVALTTRPG